MVSHQAILDYLETSGFEESAEIFKNESRTEPSPASSSGMLVKKWTSVLRQQKKVGCTCHQGKGTDLALGGRKEVLSLTLHVWVVFRFSNSRQRSI